MQVLKRVVESALDWLGPRECAACSSATRAGFCADCRRAFRPPEPRELDGVPVLAATTYRSPIDHAIRRFKYEQRPDFAHALANLIRPPCGTLDEAILIPVPLHPSRLAERGFNQSALLARRLAGRFGVAVAPLALRRRFATEQQATLGSRDRERNVLDAFVARSGASLADRRVVLVDDVVTTGATARGCITALRRSGARPIAVLCVAMTAIPGCRTHDNC